MMMRSLFGVHCWVGLALTVATLGCSPSGPPPVGIVQFDNAEPVQSGSVEFRSLVNGERYAGRIASNGSFELQDAKGIPSLPPGDYEVVVVQIVSTEDLALDDHQHGRTVPRRYADYYTSDLRVSNQPDRTQPIVVQLAIVP